MLKYRKKKLKNYLKTSKNLSYQIKILKIFFF